VADSSVGGLLVPGFTIVRMVGSGGFATVYEAIQDDIGSRVALKVLPSDVDPADALRRLDREYRSMGRLREHPGVVTVFETTSSTAGHPVIVMKFMAGGSLRDRVTNSGPLSVEETLRIAEVLASALVASHRIGVFHRDVKPENVLFDAAGEVALADFGLATIEGVIDGSATLASLSPPHAPPERFRSDPVEPVSADVYSLASTLFFALEATPPFGTIEDGGLAGLISRIVNNPPPGITRTDVPAGLVALIADSLAKEPSGRPADAAEFHQRLTNVRDVRFESETTDAQRSTGPAVAARRAVFASIGLVVVLAAGLIAFRSSTDATASNNGAATPETTETTEQTVLSPGSTTEEISPSTTIDQPAPGNSAPVAGGSEAPTAPAMVSTTTSAFVTMVSALNDAVFASCEAGPVTHSTVGFLDGDTAADVAGFSRCQGDGQGVDILWALLSSRGLVQLAVPADALLGGLSVSIDGGSRTIATWSTGGQFASMETVNDLSSGINSCTFGSLCPKYFPEF